MYVARRARAMCTRIFLTEYAIIFSRLYVNVLLHVHERTKTTRTFQTRKVTLSNFKSKFTHG
jgi:hypothetical protein